MMENTQNELPNYYAIIPAEVRYDLDLLDKAKLLYGEITALSMKEGYCYATNTYFAELYGISTRQVQTILKNLADKKYITIDMRKKPRKIYISNVKNTPFYYEENFALNTSDTKKTSSYHEENFVLEGEENFTHNNININNNKKNTKKVIEYSQEFETWYAKYPNPRNKMQTYRNYLKRRKQYSADELMTALNNYVAEIAEKRIDKQYVKYSSNFVGRDGTFEEYVNTVTPQERNDEYFADYEYLERLRRWGEC